MTGISYALFAAAILVALAYFPMTGAGHSNLRSLTKTLPLLLLSASSFAAGAPPLLTAALFLSALGDFALSRQANAAFLYGLASFALAHLLYAGLFMAVAGAPAWDAFAYRPIFAIAMVLIAVSTEIWLSAHTENLRWPVRVYVLIISVMMLAALVLPASYFVTILGAGFFVLSDLILSVQLFRMQDEHPASKSAGYGVWFFYVAGQALILCGFIAL